MSKPVIIVTGANGQLGKELHALEGTYSKFRFVFLSREDLPIHHFELVSNFFKAYKPNYLINCAAYTAVDRAESERELAHLVNGTAPGILASIGKEYGTKTIHISTDYVFAGDSPIPYKETDPTGPLSVYGASKLAGEIKCMEGDPSSIIIRTAWVYSTFGNNFVKTMLRLMEERPSISVVNDQIGAPTYAADLAEAIMKIIDSGSWMPGIYHYSNAGKISWYDFAKAIAEEIGDSTQITPIPSSHYPTAAQRPSFSLLDTQKIQDAFHLSIPHWRDSLKKCLNKIVKA